MVPYRKEGFSKPLPVISHKRLLSVCELDCCKKTIKKRIVKKYFIGCGKIVEASTTMPIKHLK
jgi:hypothetical protein